MLRASAVCEAAGIPTASLTCEGFMRQAATTSVGLGMPNIPVALVPGHTGVQARTSCAHEPARGHARPGRREPDRQPQAASAEARTRRARRSSSRAASKRSTSTSTSTSGATACRSCRRRIARIEAFLRFTDRKPDEVLGVLLPDSRAATVWSVAVNGVMAGCRPEYMPVLVALARRWPIPSTASSTAATRPAPTR